MYLYHGTDSASARNIVESGIDFGKCDELTDNARGFYLSRKKEFADERALFMTGSGKKAAVVELQYDAKKANRELEVLNFRGVSEDWQYFVAFNRVGAQYYTVMNSLFPSKTHNLDFKYDVVIDIPADAGISKKTYEIEEILTAVSKKKRITENDRSDIIKLIRSISIGDIDPQAKQYSFHTKKSLSYLSNARIIELGHTYHKEKR